MRIGFVAEPYEERNASGMGYVIMELMHALPQEGAQHEFVFYSSKPVDRTLVPGNFTNVSIPRGFLRKMWYFFRLPDAPDVLIFMVPMMPLIVRRCISIPMCQELASQKIKPTGIRETVFAFVRDQILMRLSFAYARHIIAASNATKQDLMRFYRLKDSDITVVYDGFQSLEKYAKEAKPVNEGFKPYFFFIGKVKYRKNVHGIIAAFIALKKRTSSAVQLVIAGDYGGPYYEKIIASLRANGLEGDVHFVGYTTKGELYSYYTNALACVFPSINEGFGMPIIEAMSLGVPVITSNISSMAEVAADAALLVDPHDYADISRAMERIATDAALRGTLVARGYGRAKVFDWHKAAREYIAVAETT